MSLTEERSGGRLPAGEGSRLEDLLVAKLRLAVSLPGGRRRDSFPRVVQLICRILFSTHTFATPHEASRRVQISLSRGDERSVHQWIEVTREIQSSQPRKNQ